MKTIIQYSILVISLLVCHLAIAQVDCEYSILNRIRPGVAGPDFPLPELPEVGGEGFTPEEPNASDKFRLVYFVHGLNGSISAWDKAASISEDGADNFPARMVIATKPEYGNNQYNFRGAASTLRQQIGLFGNLEGLPEDYDMKNSIFIGHSQGGLVGRYLDFYYSSPSNRRQRSFGGLVTVATSNQGAWIINGERQHGLLTREINSITSELSAGPTRQLISSNNFLMSLFGQMINADKIVSEVKEFADRNIGEILIAKNLPPITNEYMVGAPMITQTLNTYEPVIESSEGFKRTNIVAFYSIRDTLLHKQSPVDLEVVIGYNNSGDPIKATRTVHGLPLPISTSTINYFIDDVNKSADFGGMDDEWKFPAAFYTTRVMYDARVIHNNFQRQQYQRRRNYFMARPNLPLFVYYSTMMNNAIERRNAWQRGVDYLDNFDRSYRVIIGALSTEQYSRNFMECQCTAVNDMNGEVIDLGSRFIFEGEDCESFYAQQFPPNGPFQVNCMTRFIPITTFQWRHKDSDGVVLAESAMDIPQATYPPVLLDGSTHMCVRNDENTRVLLSKIYDGEVGLFFKTDKK